ncbi:MAG: uroporphyrinogen-III C-methyltransferase [Myxococcota bacterium]
MSAASLRHGRISLIGAGPGDPDLLTVRAWRRLQNADVVIADRLVPPALLAVCPGEIRVARKPRGRAEAGQRELEAWTLTAARAGRDVVRLKTGDPFVFGRASEEVDAFTAAGFAVEVVPGLSSVTAAPVAAGIPLTMRGVADRFTVITGQGRDGRWVAPPPFCADETLVLLMGVGRAEVIADQLMAHAWPAETPVAIVERATHADERLTRTNLQNLGATVHRKEIRAPAVFIVGAVTAYRPPSSPPGFAVAPPISTRASGRHPRLHPAAGSPS